jgi:hypothetical protein
MKDDAIYCEHPDGGEMAYIPYWRHEALKYQRTRRARRVIWALIALLIGSNAAWIITRL